MTIAATWENGNVQEICGEWASAMLRVKNIRFIALIATSICAFSLATLCFFRWLETQIVCTGETLASPNAAYSASAMDCSGTRFFSNQPVHYFEFSLVGPQIKRVIKTTPLPGPFFGSRSSTKVIKWQTDSSAVRFVFVGSEIRLNVKVDD